MPQNTLRARRSAAPSRFGRNNFRSGGYRSNKRKPTKQAIDYRMFVKEAKPVESTDYTATHTFEDFKVHPGLAENIRSKGYVIPSPIQDQAIPHALDGKDVIGLANTGTGKTAAFSIPMIQQLVSNTESKALVVAPTRELAQQIDSEIRSLVRGSRIRTAILTGGSPMYPQVRDLRNDPRIIIGTPGRIKDHATRGNFDLKDINIVVLDEVDRMLDMGFVADITEMLNNLNPVRQSLFFSATMDPKIKQLINNYSNDPVTISVITGNTGENIHQDVVTYGFGEVKIEKLHDVLNDEVVAKVLVFDETKRSVDKLQRELESRGFSVDSIHGDKTQGQRKRALDRFRKSDVKILVATDVAARGIDIVDVTHVINYSVPQSYDDYVHRIGRAGRAGRTGYALTFVNV